jgi:rubredoxin
MARLRCTSCKLVYEQAAMARHLTLTTSSTCRRCGGGLELEERKTGTPMDAVPAVLAVRSSVTGQARLPFG